MVDGLARPFLATAVAVGIKSQVSATTSALVRASALRTLRASRAAAGDWHVTTTYARDVRRRRLSSGFARRVLRCRRMSGGSTSPECWHAIKSVLSCVPCRSFPSITTCICELGTSLNLTASSRHTAAVTLRDDLRPLPLDSSQTWLECTTSPLRRRCEVYLLFWYKSTNTDTEGAESYDRRGTADTPRVSDRRAACGGVMREFRGRSHRRDRGGWLWHTYRG